MYYITEENELKEWSNSSSFLSDPKKAKYINISAEFFTEFKSSFKVVDGILIDISNTEEYVNEQLDKAKSLKIAENEQKRNVSKIETTLGYLKTQTPLGGIKTALLLYSNIANANGGLPQGAVRLYDRYGDIVLSPAITLAEFNALLLEISMAYIAIDTKSTQITQAIWNAETLAELEEIEIKYEDEFEVKVEEEPPFVPDDEQPLAPEEDENEV